MTGRARHGFRELHGYHLPLEMDIRNAEMLVKSWPSNTGDGRWKNKISEK